MKAIEKARKRTNKLFKEQLFQIFSKNEEHFPMNERMMYIIQIQIKDPKRFLINALFIRWSLGILSFRALR
jgi:hypothetical protein